MNFESPCVYCVDDIEVAIFAYPVLLLNIAYFSRT